MRSLGWGFGLMCIGLVMLDGFQTVILPRRASGRFRITRLFYRASWGLWRFFGQRLGRAHRRETFLSFYGPLSLVLLIALWALLLIAGFGSCFYGAGSPFADSQFQRPTGAMTDFYVSGTTLFTLGLGDVVPTSRVVRFLLVLEAGTGLGFLALVIGYFPVVYGAFSRREIGVVLLGTRAGLPSSAAELMSRHAAEGAREAFVSLLADWERWLAEMLESHISYPLLGYFRSQHDNQSWISAVCTILDVCAVVLAMVEDAPTRRAQLTFSMARQTVVDLCTVFALTPGCIGADRLPPSTFRDLREVLSAAGINLAHDDQALQRMETMRSLYEPFTARLGRHFMMELPPFLSTACHQNWKKVAGVCHATETAQRVAAHHDREARIF